MNFRSKNRPNRLNDGYLLFKLKWTVFVVQRDWNELSQIWQVPNIAYTFIKQLPSMTHKCTTFSRRKKVSMSRSLFRKMEAHSICHCKFGMCWKKSKLQVRLVRLYHGQSFYLQNAHKLCCKPSIARRLITQKMFIFCSLS